MRNCVTLRSFNNIFLANTLCACVCLLQVFQFIQKLIVLPQMEILIWSASDDTQSKTAYHPPFLFTYEKCWDVNKIHGSSGKKIFQKENLCDSIYVIYFLVLR